MPNLLPHLIDMPMSLGDHLGELRRRLVVPIAVLLGVFIAGFAMQAQLKLLLIHP